MEIEQYSKEYRIAFREDASNAHDKYLRNYIRHHILPAFDEINPQFWDSMTGNMEKISDAYLLYQYALERMVPDLIRKENDLVFIDISKLIATPAPKTILFEILKPYGFSASASEEIYHMLESESGRQFLSSSYKVVKDRSFFNFISGSVRRSRKVLCRRRNTIHRITGTA
jgi:tRNA(Ile)-lysidine synthase